MTLYQIYKVELLKILKKPIVLILCINFILPLFYTMSIFSNAEYLTVQGEFSAIIFASVNWNMLTMAGIMEVLFAIITAQIFAYELEKGQIRLLAIRVCSRKKLMLAKVFTLVTLLVLTYVVFYLFCFALYFMVIVNTSLGTGEFGINSLEFMLQDLIYIVQLLIVTCVVFLLSLYFKASVSMMLGIGLTAIFIFMQFFPVIKYFVPAYLATALSYSQISTKNAAVLCGVYFIFALLPLAFALQKFEKIDLR